MKQKAAKAAKYEDMVTAKYQTILIN